MWRKPTIILIAVLAATVDFVSRVLSVAVDLSLMAALLYVAWPLLSNTEKGA